MYCPTEATVTPYTVIRRERRLPFRGDVLVRVGDWLEPQDVVARGSRPGQIRLVDVAKALAVSDEQASKYLRKSTGDAIQTGEIIAVKRGPIGLFSKAYRSPIDGSVITVSRGRVLLQSAPETLELTAALRGQVVKVIAGYGALIETQGGLVEGVWGLGERSWGVLKMAVASPDQPLTAKSIEAKSQGYILVGGSVLDAAALMQASKMKVKGIVVGGIHASLMEEVGAGLPFPLVITEGLGEMPMASVVFDLLQSAEGQEAFISGQVDQQGARVRPEVIVFSPIRAEPFPAECGGWPLRPGDLVRIVRAPHLGAIGTVKAILDTPRPVNSGLVMKGADVALPGSESVFVPLANLERIQ